MNPISFHKDEKVFTLPGDESVLPLPVLHVRFANSLTYCLVSCWKPDWRDLWRMITGKPIYLVLWSPVQPPVSLTTDVLIEDSNGL